MKIQYYKTNHGIFFKPEINFYSMDRYIFNGVDGNLIPKYGSFYKVDSDELVVMHRAYPTRVCAGWKLKNPALESNVLPITLEQSSIVEDYDDDEKVWTGSFADYFSLYEQVYEEQPARIEPVEITLVFLGELLIENLTKPEETKVVLASNNWLCTKLEQLNLAAIVSYDELLKIVVPDFMLHNHPCSLSSEQVYKIVRAFVKENFNPKVAKISSDYDFCFSVQKVFTTAKPINVSKEVKKANGRSYATPRFTTVKANTSSLQIFEMTWAGYGGKVEGYSGYTAISPWKADNLEDMRQQVKVYLESLMSVLNTESKECECCKGTGFIFETRETK